MGVSKAEQSCIRCGGLMVRGHMRVKGAPAAGVRVEFVIPGVATSLNPLKAFRQGLADEVEDEVINLDGMGAYLCRGCGALDLFAWLEMSPAPALD